MFKDDHNNVKIYDNSFAIIATLSHNEELRTYMGNNYSRKVTCVYKILKEAKFSVNFSSVSAMLSLPPRQPILMQASPGI